MNRHKMKTFAFGPVLLLATFLFAVFSCSTGQSKQENDVLSPAAFAQKLKENPGALVLDVRSPGEFAGGALPNARNLDWNGADFEKTVAGFPKSDPVFVYCLSGGRSGSAAAYMRKNGFAKVYEMDGGLMKWRADGVTMDNAPAAPQKAKGMQKAEFEALLNTDKTVLVDFYADWCGPCKKMKPDLDRLGNDKKATLTVLRIDADANPDLAKQLGVSALPTLFVYKNKQQTTRKDGYQTLAQMEEMVK